MEKTIKEWIEGLPEPQRSLALENPRFNGDSVVESPGGAVSSMFDWGNSPQGGDYWLEVRGNPYVSHLWTAPEPAVQGPAERTAKEWLNDLPEPLRSGALKAVEERPHVPQARASSMSYAVNIAFLWGQDGDIWAEINGLLGIGNYDAAISVYKNSRLYKEESEREAPAIEVDPGLDCRDMKKLAKKEVDPVEFARYCMELNWDGGCADPLDIMLESFKATVGMKTAEGNNPLAAERHYALTAIKNMVKTLGKENLIKIINKI